MMVLLSLSLTIMTIGVTTNPLCPFYHMVKKFLELQEILVFSVSGKFLKNRNLMG